MNTPILLHHYRLGDHLHVPTKIKILQQYKNEKIYESIRAVVEAILVQHIKADDAILAQFREHYPPITKPMKKKAVQVQIRKSKPFMVHVCEQPTLDSLRQQHDCFLLPKEYVYCGKDFARDLQAALEQYKGKPMERTLLALGNMTGVLPKGGPEPIAMEVAYSRQRLIIHGKCYPNVFEPHKIIPFPGWRCTLSRTTTTLACEGLFKLEL